MDTLLIGGSLGLRTDKELCAVNDIGDGQRRRLPDGSAVTMSGNAVDFSRPSTSFAELSGPAGNQQFAVGTLTFGEWSAREVGVTSFDEEFAFQGGKLRIGSAVVKNNAKLEAGVLAHMGVWEGQLFSVKTQVLGGDTAQVIKAFSHMEMTEHSDGVQFTPVTPGVDLLRLGGYVPRLLKVIPGLGVIETRSRADSKGVTPEADGLEVEGGRLYVDGSEERPSLLLVGGSALTSIVPERDSSEQAVLDTASRLSVEWQPPTEADPDSSTGRSWWLVGPR